MDKKDNEIKEIKKMSADAYIKNKEIRKNIIKKETLKVDNEIKTKSERLIKALEDLNPHSAPFFSRIIFFVFSTHQFQYFYCFLI
jgi:hypothetical protein